MIISAKYLLAVNKRYDCVSSNQTLSDKKVRELRELAASENIALSDETRICRFDPPFKPGFLQYNEIVIPLLDK